MSDSSLPDSHPAGPVAGRVVDLRSYPVKSLGARSLDVVQVLGTGLEHDRGWAVTGADGDVVTARTAPDLRTVSAAAPEAAGGPVVLELPGQPLPVRGASADVALSQLVGRPVRVQAAAGAGTGFQEVAAVHLVSRQAVTQAAGTSASAGDGVACDVEEPRANVFVDLADGAELETSWVGREVHLGAAVLRVTRVPKNCLGVYAEVVRPGTVAVGDDLRLA